MVFNPFVAFMGKGRNHVKTKGSNPQVASQNGQSAMLSRYLGTYGTAPHTDRKPLARSILEAVVLCQIGKASGHSRIVYKKKFIANPQQPKLVTPGEAISATLAESNPFRLSHDTSVPDAQHEEEVDISGVVVHSWSEEGIKIPAESVSAHIVEGYYDDDTAALSSDEQDVSQVSEVTQAADDFRQITSRAYQVATPTSLTLYRPSAYLQVNDAALTYGVEPSAVSAAPTCTALVLYTTSVQVEGSTVRFAQVLYILLVAALCSCARVDSTTPPTVSAHSTSYSPRATISSAPGSYRTTTHFQKGLKHIRVLDHLLATSTSAIEMFWQGVLTKSCTSMYRESIALETFASLRASVDNVLEFPSSKLTGSDVVSDEPKAAEEQPEHSVVVRQCIENIGQTLDYSSIQTIAVSQPLDEEAPPDHKPTESVTISSPRSEVSTPATSDGCVEHDQPIQDCLDGLQEDALSTLHPVQQLGPAEEPVPEELSFEDEERQQLEEEMRRQQSMCQQFRQQLAEKETELDEVNSQLREVHRERKLLVDESEESFQETQALKRELVLIKRQLAAEQTASTTSTVAEAPRPHPDVDGPEIVAACNSAQDEAMKARQEANKARDRVKFVEEMLNAVVRENKDLKHQLQVSQRVPEQPRSPNTSDLIRINDYLRDSIQQLDVQLNGLVQQKKASDIAIANLEAYNQTLVTDWTNKLIEMPRENVNPSACTYNEAKDLRQQVESAQTTSQRYIASNQILEDEIMEQKKKVQRLESDEDLLRNKCGELMASFGVLQGLVDDFMDSLPETTKTPSAMSEEELTAHHERLRRSEKRIEKTNNRLKAAALKVADIESKMATIERNHKSDLAHFEEHLKQVESEKIRLDGENFDMEHKLQDAQQEVDRLKQQRREAMAIAEEWKAECESGAFGDTAELIRDNHQREVTWLKNQLHALQHINTELRLGKEHALGDIELFRHNFANTMTRLDEFETSLRYARDKCGAMEERFAEQLRCNPVYVRRHNVFDNMSQDQKMERLRREDELIEGATGINFGRGRLPDRELALDIWSILHREVQAVQNGQSQGSGEASGAMSTTSSAEANGVNPEQPQRVLMTPAGSPATILCESTPHVVEDENVEGQDESAWQTESDSSERSDTF